MGLTMIVMGVYAAEVGTPKKRGRLILITTIAVSTGILFIYILGFFMREDWKPITYSCCIYQLISTLLIIPMPETPMWLLSKGREAEAKKVLNYFRGGSKKDEINQPDVMDEWNSMKLAYTTTERENVLSFWKLLILPEVYKPFAIMMGNRETFLYLTRINYYFSSKDFQHFNSYLECLLLLFMQYKYQIVLELLSIHIYVL